MPAFTLTYEGFKNGETEAVLSKQPTVSCEATEASAPGEYAVQVSGAEAQNSTISYAAGKLIVTEADAVVITAKSYTRKYGAIAKKDMADMKKYTWLNSPWPWDYNRGREG